MKWTVEVSKEWTEPGSVVVEADDEDEARDIVMGMLVDGSDEIEWDGSNMSPGNQCVEGIERNP